MYEETMSGAVSVWFEKFRRLNAMSLHRVVLWAARKRHVGKRRLAGLVHSFVSMRIEPLETYVQAQLLVSITFFENAMGHSSSSRDRFEEDGLCEAITTQMQIHSEYLSGIYPDYTGSELQLRSQRLVPSRGQRIAWVPLLSPTATPAPRLPRIPVTIRAENEGIRVIVPDQ